MEKRLYIFRGQSGSGKTTAAASLFPPERVREADNYFVKDGKYSFDPNRLRDAHAICLEQVKSDLINLGTACVSNTFTTEAELQPYLQLAAREKARVFVFLVQNYHGGQTVHDVPEETVRKQIARLKNSLFEYFSRLCA